VGEAVIRAVELIERKRNGHELAPDELRELVLGFTRGEVPDYQMAAFLMAVYFRGLSTAETHALTDAMVASGETIELGKAIGRRCVDKHSTGGVGDKTSIAVGPIVAACGVPFGKMSGRGLGHTGGTLDKLESIPGYRVELTTQELVAQVREVGLAIVGQSAQLVPADQKLYALRDVTATVDNLSLIAASIMSKKLAGGADAIVLDVKVGDGAFMKTLEDAQALAETMIQLGRRAEREVVCLLTDMDQPLGQAVGNALEVREALTSVRGQGPPDLDELVRSAASHLLALSDLGVDEAEGRRRVDAAIADGRAAAAYERWIRAQGGDPAEDALPRAPVVREVRALRAGVVRRLGAVRIGLAALHLGAGRATKEDAIDHAVGVVCRAKRGDEVAAGDVLAEVHARDATAAAGAEREVLEAYELGDEPPRERKIVLDVLSS
jgi:pyrimidine-nucleoside phosphorylase